MGHIQNIHIWGLHEAMHDPDLIPMLKGIFQQILEDEAPDCVEIDRAHRGLMALPQATDTSRDVICKIHKYAVKEDIMKAMQGKFHVDFDGAQLLFFPDLFRRIHRSLLPALQVLHWEGS